jgi:hypothetical protein
VLLFYIVGGSELDGIEVMSESDVRSYVGDLGGPSGGGDPVLVALIYEEMAAREMAGNQKSSNDLANGM